MVLRVDVLSILVHEGELSLEEGRIVLAWLVCHVAYVDPAILVEISEDRSRGVI